MAVTGRGIVTPNQADEYNLVTDLNTMATSIDEALQDAANSYRGTSSQRTQFTSQAPEGTIWVDTNGEKIVWVKQGVSWRRIWPEEDTGWLPLPLSAGWQGGSNDPPHYRIRDNEVMFQGVINRSSGNVPNTYTEVFKVPTSVGFPAKQMIAIRSKGMGAGGAPVGWDINVAQRSARAIVHSGLGVASTWASIDHLRWRMD